MPNCTKNSDSLFCIQIKIEIVFNIIHKKQKITVIKKKKKSYVLKCHVGIATAGIWKEYSIPTVVRAALGEGRTEFHHWSLSMKVTNVKIQPEKRVNKKIYKKNKTMIKF